MPIYEYKGQQYDIATEDPAEAKFKILSYIEKLPPAPPPKVPDPINNPALSPQEQFAAAALAPQGITSLRKPSAVPEMTQYNPTLTDLIMGMLPGDKAKAANEYAARKAAEERGVSVEEIYKGSGGVRPMFNPEGRAPILAGTQAAEIIAGEIPKIPGQAVAAGLQAIRAGDIGAPGQESWLDKTISAMNPQTPEGEQDKNYDAFQGLSKSMGFSLASMVGSIVAGQAAAVVTGPVGGVATGMGASGTIAYRASKDDFLSRVRDKLNQESLKLYNKPISESDWNNAKREFDGAASAYGAWEAVPEAISNAIMLKAFTAPARVAAGAGRLEQFMVKNNIAEKATSLLTENATETITGLGQNKQELKAGLTKDELDIADAFRQQFIQTLLMGGGMEAGTKATRMASQFYKDKIEPRIDPGTALGRAIMADLNEVEFSQNAINKEVVARLNPNNVKTPQQIATEKAAQTGRGVAMGPPPPEEPPAPPAPPPVPPAPSGLTAAPSESMDTEAMLREALEEPPKGTVTPVNVKEEEAPTTKDKWLKAINDQNRMQPEGGVQLTVTPEGKLNFMGNPSATKQGKALEATLNEAIKAGATIEEIVASINSVKQPAPRSAIPLTPPSAQEAPAVESAKEEMTPAERLKRANVSMFNAQQMLASKQITQEQFDNLDRQYQEIKAKVEAAAPAVELTPIQQEALDIADQIEALGQKEFASGMRSAIKKSGYQPANLDFYKQKLQDFGAQKGVTEKPKESFDVASFLTDNEQKYYTSFQQNAPQPAKEAFAKLTSALDEVIAGANSLGYKILDINPLASTEAKKLREQYSVLSADLVKLLSSNYAIQNEHKRANPEKFDKLVNSVQDTVDNAQGVISDSVPAPVEPVDQTKLPGRSVVEAPLNKLTLSEDVPQFKADANKAGIVEPLGGKFERTGVAPIQVWRRTDGRLEVISGRHRFDLAKRSGEETIPAQIHDEASGFTRDMAAVLDAELNIRDGQGKVKDYVNYFKGTGLDQKTADTRGLLARAPGKRAFTIANQGSDELVAGVRADQIGDEAAYLIALNAPNDSRLQGVAIKAIQDGKSAANAIGLLQAVRALAGETDTTLDMFGYDDSGMKEAEAMAKIATAKQREVQTRLSAITGAAKNPAVAKAEGIDIKDPEAVKRRIDDLKQMKVAWDNYYTNPDLIAEIRADRGMPPPAAREEEVPAAIENEIDQLFGSVEEAEQMVADNLTPKEQDDELEKARNEQAKDKGAAERAESESQDLFAEPSETLTSPTPEGLKAQEDRRKAVEAAESKADKDAAAKEKADREAGEFVLTGSDRVADEAAARGQKDIFAEDEVEEEGVKVVPFEADSETVGKLLSETQEGEDPSDIRRNALMHSTEKPAKPKPTEMLTPKEAKAQIDKWKAEAKRQGETSKNYGRTILSLFDASGEWSRPWQEAGYDVHTFDIQTGEDINDFNVEYLLENGFGDLDVWGILAAPPCTDFASSGAQFWATKDTKGQTKISNELVMQVLRTVSFLQPKIWALENPVGRIAKLNNLPPAHLTFDPNYYGDPYTKKTLLWGNFENNLPMAPVEPTEGSKIHKISGKDKYARSLTPEGFAYAFFIANNAESMTPTERLTRTYYGVDPNVFEGATEADEKAIKSSEFEDSYYDGDLEGAANIASYIINGEPDIQEELPSEEYQEALDESNVAIKEFKQVQEAYRAQEIGDDEFLAGRKAYDVAMAKFDRAYQKEGEPAKLEPVDTPEGGKLRYPMAAVLFNDGFKVLPLNDSRSYVDKGGKVHRTFIKKEGVRVSLTPQLVLFQNKNAVLTGQGESTDLVINALLVDQSKRGQGLASETLQNITAAADQYGITLYLEPTPLVNIQEKNFGLDRQQLEDLYQKFGFEFAEDSNKVMVRDPEVEVLGPAEKPQAPRLTNEPYTIEGEFTEVGEERQNALLDDQVSKLKKDQINTLEDLYGAKRGTSEFIERVRKDVIAFINQGAVAVKGRIRSIIRQMASGVLSAALVFNPAGLTNNFKFNLSKTYRTTVTTQVKAEVPANAKAKMSTLAQSVYESMAPTAKASGKGFIIADKPNGMLHVFFADGSMLIQDTALYGKDIGDVEADVSSLAGGPKITPAGKFSLVAMPSPEYAGGVTLALAETGGNGIIAVHSVYLGDPKEKRLERLAMPGAEGKRISYGCINTAEETFLKSILPNIDALDGGMIFVLPDNQIATAAMFPAETKTTVTEERVPAPKPGVERKQTGREEKVKVTQKEQKKEAPEGPGQNLYSLEVKQTKTPSFLRWFGDSKVVDEDGKPLMVYHGTDAPVAIDSFLKSNSGNEGYWFAGDVSLANDFATRRNGENAAVYPVYLAINKVAPSLQAWNSSVDAKDGKYDGYIGTQPDGRKVYSVLRNTQIKSAIGNTGAFDATNPDIRYSLDAYVKEEESKRSPSLIRRLKTLNRQHKEGKLSDEQYITMSDEAIREDYENKFYDPAMARKRGYLLIQEKLSAAARRGEISREIFDLANWFMSQNEDLVSDLGISITGKGADGTGGFYNNLSRVFTLMKGASSDLTAVHEILHHLERMMPAKVQQAIRKAWASQLAKAAKQAKTPAEKLYFAALMDAHYGSNQHSMLNIPEGAGKAYSDVRAALEDMEGSSSSAKFAETMLKLGLVPMDHYEYFNPSEFWAVNGSDIVKARFDAVKGGVLARLKNWLKELGQKIKSIFGMKSDASIIRALDSLAKSDGEFVTKEMLGQGDYFSIRNYQGNAAPTALWNSPIPSFVDGIRYQLEDKNIDMRRVIEAINAATGKIDERLDAYTKETQYHGRTGERTLDFLEKDFRPMFEQMKKEGVTVEALEEYLHNRHAEERNEQINKINLSPDVQDMGSGIETSAAQSYLANLPAADRLKLERFADEIDSIIDDTQQILVDGGIETQDTIDTWNKTYQYYVPLQRDDLDFVHTGSGYVGGVGTRGSSSKRAVGSLKPVKDILSNVLTQRESAIRRAEQAKVGRALYALAITNPNPKFWLPINPNAIKDKAKLVQEMVSLGLTIQDAQNLIREPQSPIIDKATGLVRYQVNQAQYNSDNVFPIRINGEDRFIIFNPKDERAMRMALSLKNMDADQLGWFLGTMGQVTRWIASINTQYNPVFGAWNMTRDVQSAALNLSTTEIAGKEKAVLGGTLPAMFAIWRSLRGKPASSPEQQANMDLFDRLRLAGGTTGFAQQFSGQRESFDKFVERMKTGAPKEKVTIIEKEMKRLNRGNASKVAHSLFEWLSDYNDAMENAVRLSAFRVALDQGLSEQQAASVAKELTVNFNRKGASSPTLQALYAFINASIQGTSRLIKTLNGPLGKKIIIGGITLGVIQAIALALNGYDDGDPPDFLKDKNFIIPIPFSGKNYIILPMPPGLNVFPGIGRIITETILIKSGDLKSNKGAGDKALGLGMLILDSFNPLGAGSITQMLAPTFADPLFAIKANVDAFGRPIYKKDMPSDPTPGYERSRPTATFISQGIAEFLNWMTAPVGTKHTKGMISPTADELDYLAGQYVGGLSREIIKGVGAAQALAKGEETPAYKVPILGKLYGETGTPAAITSRFYDNISQMSEYEHEVKKRIENKEPTAKYMKDNPSAKLWKDANTAEAAIKKLTKERKAYIASGNSSKAGLKELDDKKVRLMKEFNSKVRATQ